MFNLTERVKIVTYTINTAMHFLHAADNDNDIAEAVKNLKYNNDVLRLVLNSEMCDDSFAEYVDYCGIVDCLCDCDDDELANDLHAKQVFELLAREGFIEL